VVSVVVVTWNCRQAVLDCLESLKDNPPSVGWEVIVVDNGSADETVDAIRASAPWARVIANRSNRGLPAANNQGMVAASGEALLISNPDVIWQPGAVDAMLSVLRRHPRAAWVVPLVRYEDGTLCTTAGDLPTFADALIGRQGERLRRHRATDPTSGQWWDGWAHDEERSIGRGYEAAYLMRRQAVEEVGLQDESYVLDWEGADWTARLRDQGWQIWLCPEAEVIHLGGQSIRQVPLRWIVSSHRGMYRYFASRSPAVARPAIAVAVAARAGAKLAAAGAGAALYERAFRGAPGGRTKRAPGGTHTTK